MKSRELNRQYDRIKWLIGQTSSASFDELELQAHWGKYLCVLVAGFIENSIGEIYSEYAKQASSPSVASFVARVVLGIQNPKAHKFIETANGFKAEWGDDLEIFLNNDGRKEAIDGIMSNRNLIAHGRPSGITITRVNEYLNKIVDVVEYIEKQCGI